MNVIFLDVNGVLISNEHLNFIKAFMLYDGNVACWFDDECLTNLKHVVDETKSKIIITSKWRFKPEYLAVLLDKLKEYELEKDIISLTVNNKYNNKLEEIYDKINKLNIDNYIILDSNRKLNIPNHFETNSNTGLTYNDAKRVVKRLTLI